MNEYKPDISKALIGHTSPETAYVVDDYPYGFRLRCKIRYWLECKPKHGFRFVSQTTNPKRPGEVWNKPKPSTYVEFAAFMFLDSIGHVQWHGLGVYNSGAECAAWQEKYGEFVNPEWQPLLARWVKLKTEYDQRKVKITVVEKNLHEAETTISVITEDFIS